MRIIASVFAAFFLTATVACAQGVPTTDPALSRNETPAQRDARMQWWRAARFGMFIHWGIYSVPAGVYDGKPVTDLGEWIMHNAKIPVATYAQYASKFNPTKFDADAWVKLASDAGMKYMVITAKHHDGFAMFHTAVDSYNIYDATPFKRDPLKELSEAAARQDMRLGFYYSQAQDWHQPGGAVMRGPHWDPAAQDGDMDAYLKRVAVPQVKELLTNYGKVAVLWFDTPVDMTPARAALFMPLLDLQPGIVVNNRLLNGLALDTETPEQRIPATGYPDHRDWETCMTINSTWGFKSTDTNFKSTQTLLRDLINCASRGGNFLLNVGPDSSGTIPQPEVDRLLEIGAWLKTNGEAIYDTSPSSIIVPAAMATTTTARSRPRAPAEVWDWRCTTKPGKLFLHIFQWPGDGTFKLTGIPGTVKNAYLLADPRKAALPVAQDGSNVAVRVPPEAPDKIASVIVLEMQ